MIEAANIILFDLAKSSKKTFSHKLILFQIPFKFTLKTFCYFIFHNLDKSDEFFCNFFDYLYQPFGKNVVLIYMTLTDVKNFSINSVSFIHF